jgi:hypothetical protein
MRVLTLLKQHAKGVIDGCGYYRQHLPHRAMAVDYGYKFKNINTINEMPIEEIKEFNLFHISRNDMNGYIKRAQKAGLCTVFDIDDYWGLDTTHQLYNYYRENKIPQDTIECMKMADVVTTTNEFLGARIMPYNSNVKILPNAVSVREPQFRLEHKPIGDKVVFGWIGGVHHLEDIALLRDSMGKLWNDPELKGKFQVVYAGYANQPQHDYIATILSGGKANKNDKGQYVPQEDFLILPAADVNNFAYYYEMCDIMLAPLKETTFNICKSNLKIVEAGFKGKFVIGSATMNYSYDLRKSAGIAVPQRRAHKDFYEWMRHFILNRDDIKRRQHLAYDYVTKEYNLEDVNQKRKEIFEQYATNMG